jgi:hypothetical protein
MLSASCHCKGATGRPDSKKIQGIVTGHAYSILDFWIIEGTKMVQLKNPWGKTEWEGDWHDGDARWTARAI